ncbi:pancreatic triacylglycerol lipase-like [Agrilus planipennis]|uniref:Pancreatic triacylglycerol lipase-like n=1 Tax=Agrilus planipennis TaxID=224129 RepID=A0A1W4X452_AGRPL|nr:pancreatic triacylglycerol lipase-like [Agrilus planipennis]
MRATPRKYQCLLSLPRRYLVIHDDEGNPSVIDILAPLPQARTSRSDITLHFYSQDNPNDAEDLSMDMSEVFASPNYDPSRLNVFIVHGWANDHFSEVNTVIREAFIDAMDVNVFVVDWGGPAGGSYRNAVANVPRVGTFLGEYIGELQEIFGLDPEDFLLVGYSLGAHVAGRAGSLLNGSVGTIVGLDPAGPLYWFTGPRNRLDPTDAQFVQVIHTNDYILGYAGNLGTVDIRPNGGGYQPGCGFDFTGSCSHSRSYLYFAESLISGGFTAWRCSSYSAFTSGACFSNWVTRLGGVLIDTSAFGSYYLDTNRQSPFSQD